MNDTIRYALPDGSIVRIPARQQWPMESEDMMTYEEILQALVDVHEWLDEEKQLSDTPEYEKLTRVVVFMVDNNDPIARSTDSGC